MPREVRTDVLIQAKTKGFARAQQEAARISRENAKAIDAQVKGFASSEKGMVSVEKEVKRLEGTLQDLANRQMAINQLMGKVSDKASPAYKDLSKQLKDVNQEAQRVTRTITSLDRAFARQREQRQGFVQGLMQGVAPGAMTFLQRGPGMRQQMMGAAIGAGARRFVGAAPSAVGGMFQGPMAAVQALQSIPLVGGALAATIARPMQQAQQAMQAQQVRLQTMPFLGGIGLQMKAGMAAQAARAPARQKAEAETLARLGTPEMEKEVRIRTHNAQLELARKRAEARGLEEPEQPRGLFANPAIERARREFDERSKLKQDSQQMAYIRQEARKGVEADVRREAEQKGSAAAARAAGRARQRVMRETLGVGMGVRFGMDINAERQFRSQVQQAGGGFGITGQERRFSRTAMAAQAAFGVAGGVSGAFLQAGRRGGLLGGGGGASRALTSALSDAMKMGLEGSEINDYLAQIASGITSWKSTGIPFNKQSMADIAGTLGTMGMGGVRGMAVAGGVSRAAEQLARTGPQSVGQVMMLRTLGGMQPGKTGMEAMEDALIRLERKQFSGKDFEQLIQGLLRAGGGGAEGRRVAYGVLQQAGIQISRGELKEMAEGASPERIEEIRRQRTVGAKRAEAVAQTPQQLARMAAEVVPSALKKQAALINQQIASGNKMIGSMQNLEQMAQRLTNTVAAKVGPLLEKLTGALDDNTKSILDLAKGRGSVAEHLETGPG